jgi:hypothetical protein
MFANLSIENELVDALPTSPAEALPPPPPPPESPINSFDNGRSRISILYDCKWQAKEIFTCNSFLDDCEFDSLNCAEAPFFLSNCEDTDDSSTAADKVGIDVAVGSEEAHGAVQKAHQHFLEEVRHLETELDVVVAAVASATSISYE